ncbi:MAG: hypothetical protein AAFV45_06810 [Pseudomonadota bacterium]
MQHRQEHADVDDVTVLGTDGAGHILIAPPGRLCGWTLAVSTQLAKRTGRKFRHIDRNDDIEIGPQDTRVYLCKFPSQSVVNAIKAGRLDAIVLVDDITANVRWETETTNTDVLKALRTQTAAMVAHHAVGCSARSKLIFPVYSAPPLVTIQRIAAAFGYAADPALLRACAQATLPPRVVEATLEEAVVALAARAKAQREKKAEQAAAAAKETAASGGNKQVAVAQPPPIPAARPSAPPPPPPSKTPQPVREDKHVLPTEVAAFTEQVTSGFLAMAEGNTNVPIIWPNGIFFLGDAPNERAPPVASIVGPTRTVLYGPYLHLPPGSYDVEIEVAFMGRIDDIPFILEFHAAPNTMLAQVRMKGRRSGSYRGRFNLQVLDVKKAIEIRLIPERGAIEGQVALRELRFWIRDDVEFSA